ncbi:MAG: DNA-formamidopyrimidine glycosylase family protein [Desulfurivibrionaceae bacterium]|nr:DNA-formamidopyrimidine glycosylase family protein [Desulfurivibrionaceae bacterium]
MPELPDVEIFRRYFNRTALHKKIASLEVESAKVLEGVGIKELQERLQGVSFTDSARHGKHMFASLSDGGWLRFHFGMTGFFKYYKNAAAAPGHPRLICTFDNGYNLAWDSQRLLGRISLVRSPEEYVKENHLGPDALEISKKDFCTRLQKKKGMIKTALMAQNVVAGLGNVYSDEVLFQSRLHPQTKTGALATEKLGQIHETMQEVLQSVIDSGIHPEEMPDRLLTAHRGRDNACPVCRAELEKIKISGRTGYLCPRCQKKE